MEMAKEKFLFGLILQGILFFFLTAILLILSYGGYNAYSQGKNVSFEVRPNQGVVKGERLMVEFSVPMFRQSIEKGLKIEPELKFEKKWLNDEQLELIVREKTKIDQQYMISIQKARTKWLIPQQEMKTFFDGPITPQVKKISPMPEEKEVGYQTPIEIEFDQPLFSMFEVKVEIEPMTGFDYQLSEDKKFLTITPKNYLAKGQEYQIAIKVFEQGTEKEKHSFVSSFFTQKPPQTVYFFDGNGNPTKTEDRMEDISPVISTGKYIHIDISSQTLIIFQDGEEKGAFKVSTGRRGMDTPIGTHQVLAKAQRPWSARYQLYMPWFVQFSYEGHGIHELPEWPGGIKEGASHLGIPVSHGCVRLGVGPAKIVYDFAEVGTAIVISR